MSGFEFYTAPQFDDPLDVLHLVLRFDNLRIARFEQAINELRIKSPEQLMSLLQRTHTSPPKGSIAYILPEQLYKTLSDMSMYHVTSNLALEQRGIIYPFDQHNAKQIETHSGVGLHLGAAFMQAMGVYPDYKQAAWVSDWVDPDDIEHITSISKDPGFHTSATAVFLETQENGLLGLSKTLKDLLKDVESTIKTNPIGELEGVPVYDCDWKIPEVSDSHREKVDDLLSALQKYFRIRGTRPEIIRLALNGLSPLVDYRDLANRVERILLEAHNQYSNNIDSRKNKATQTTVLFPVIFEFGHPLASGVVELGDNRGWFGMTYPDSRNPKNNARYECMPAPIPKRIFVPEDKVAECKARYPDFAKKIFSFSNLPQGATKRPDYGNLEYCLGKYDEGGTLKWMRSQGVEWYPIWKSDSTITAATISPVTLFESGHQVGEGRNYPTLGKISERDRAVTLALFAQRHYYTQGLFPQDTPSDNWGYSTVFRPNLCG